MALDVAGRPNNISTAKADDGAIFPILFQTRLFWFSDSEMSGLSLSYVMMSNGAESFGSAP